MKFSVVIPALNAEKTISDCISSLHDQEDLEIIVVDNGSSDSTVKKASQFRKVRILFERRRSSYIARNKAIKEAKGDIIIFLDSDCTSSPGLLKRYARIFKDSKIISASGPIYAYTQNSCLQRYCNLFSHNQRAALASITPYFATSNCAVRSSVFEKNSFREDMQSGADAEFFKRCICRNQMFFDEKAIAYHYYHDSIIHFIRKNYNYGRGQKMLRGETYIKLPTYAQLIQRHEPGFVLYRALQDISYRAGLILG